MSNALIDGVVNQRARLVEESRRVLERCEVAGELNAEDQLKLDRLAEEITTLTHRKEELETIESRRAELEDREDKFDRMVRKQDTGQTDPEQTLREKLRAFALGSEDGWAPKSVSFKIPGEVKRAYHEQRDLTKLSGAAGQFTVPTGFIARLYEHLVEFAAVRQTGAIIYTTDSGEDLLVPKTTGHGAAVLVAEAAALTETDPAFAQQTLKSYKYGQLIQISSELAQDTGIDLLDYLARAAGRGLGLASGVHFVTGTGTAQPEGVQTNSTIGVTAATGNTTDVPTDDLIRLYHSIVTGYRGRGVWLMNDASVVKVRLKKDTTNQYLWQPGLEAGQPDRLLGRPVLTDPTMPVMAANAKSILFGDFSAYYAIRDVSGVRFERSDDFAFGNDLISFRALLRTDGKPMDTTAVKAFQNSAT